MQPDRYEPLPPLTRLPAKAWAAMGTAARGATVLAALALIGIGVWMAPRIADHKRDTAAQERRDLAEARAQRIRQIQALQRPRSARTDAKSRVAAVDDLERLIAADARGRKSAAPVRRAQCRRIASDPTATRFSCTAVTSDLPGGKVSREGVVGYPYRALADLNAGRLTWCRIVGRPGEGSLGRAVTAIPARCGG